MLIEISKKILHINFGPNLKQLNILNSKTIKKYSQRILSIDKINNLHLLMTSVCILNRNLRHIYL